jgi:hypothetical protein
MRIPSLRSHWRTLLGAVIGATGGALYAYLVGCRSGTCLVTSNVWTAALFFGFTGAVVGAPGPREGRTPPASDPGRTRTRP